MLMNGRERKSRSQEGHTGVRDREGMRGYRRLKTTCKMFYHITFD